MAFDEGPAERLRERLDDPAGTAKKMFDDTVLDEWPAVASAYVATLPPNEGKAATRAKRPRHGPPK